MDVSKTIISLALMASESIAHEAEVRMGYWLRAHSGSRNNLTPFPETVSDP